MSRPPSTRTASLTDAAMAAGSRASAGVKVAPVSASMAAARVGVAAREDDDGALGHQPPDGGRADARGPARDQRSAPVESLHDR